MSHASVVRIGVIGLGNIACQHIGNILGGHVPGCSLGAVCARTESELPQKWGVPQYRDIQALIDSGLCDAVLIASPTNHHISAGLAALRAGLHVMMEKPIGLSLDEGQQLVAAQQAGQVFGLMLNQRTDPLFLAMREAIVAGSLGEITRTHWTMTNWFRPEIYFQVSDWRATWVGEGGGLLLNQCIHNLDIFQWLCGMPNTVRAFCRFGRYHDIEVEDEVTAYLEYANGASGVFIGSTGEAPGVNRFDVIGDAGSLSFDGQRLLLTTNEPATSVYNRQTQDMFGMPSATTSDITPARDGNQHARVLANFVASINGTESLIAPAAEGLHSLALANAMLLSSWNESSVSLPLDAAAYRVALNARLAQSQLRVKTDVQANVDMSASYR